jgi:hypothetical protein
MLGPVYPTPSRAGLGLVSLGWGFGACWLLLFMFGSLIALFVWDGSLGGGFAGPCGCASVVRVYEYYN